MAIAAVPAYLKDKDFSTASLGLRFGVYLPIWNPDWSKPKAIAQDSWRQIVRLNENDKAQISHLVQRQRQLTNRVHDGLMLTIDARSIAPFTTGLGNEHPLENGFAFLNPYGLPYLSGSGVKGVLRQAARELASGDWGETHGWNEIPTFPMCANDKPALDAKKRRVMFTPLDVLFGRETKDGEPDHVRGALTFWDVIPQVKGDHLHVEIMTPHQGHYYQQKNERKTGSSTSPHDSGQVTPISFLTVPPGSAFTFHVQCNRTLLQHTDLLQGEKWKALLTAAFEHAFDWCGFGAKTTVGYGAMQEDATKKMERDRKLHEKQEAERRSSMTEDEQVYEDHRPVISNFRNQFEQANKSSYQAGGPFDSLRNEFVKTVLAWEDSRSRNEAGSLLEKTLSWGVPGKKESKHRLKEALTQLKGTP